MFDSDVLNSLLLLIPLSIIGIWRWTFWAVRRIGAAMYRPNITPLAHGERRPSVSIVTPVYNEDPAVFEAAMQSWIKNGVNEIVAVIDKSNTRHILNFQKNYVNNPSLKTRCRLMVTPKPGKRAALCDGMEKATGDIIALVDSDTIWDDTVLEATLPYFKNPRIGGATVAQRINNPDTASNVMFDMMLWSRYKEEVPFLLGTGKVFNTLSGRTAFYRREAIFNNEHDNIHLLRHEFFMGTRGISGDDKRLTHLMIEQGWHTAFVLGPAVYTPGLGSVKTFFKQRLRWTRNSWRADLRAVGRGWVWKHPALAIFMVDRFFAPLFMLIGPVVFAFAITKQQWLFASILLAWWLVSRFVRIFGYFRAYPKRIVYLPAYILYGYANSVIKIYAFATLIEHSWATRWHKTRMKRKGLLRKAFTLGSGYAAIFMFIALLGQIVVSAGERSGIDIATQPPVEKSSFSLELENVPTRQQNPPEPKTLISPTSVKIYVVQQGDTFNSLAQQLGMETSDLKKLNGIRDRDEINVGQEIIYFEKGDNN